MNAQPMPEEYEPKKNWFSRLKDGLLGAEEADDEEYAATTPTTSESPRKASAPLRLSTSRSGRVAVRLNAQVFEDAKLAADGLKAGEHQIVNLERATPQMAERIIDFLNGICYALDGTVERVGDKVYMFVPANVAVEVDSGATAATSALRRANGEL